jgi:hypothetical protein
MSLMTHEECNNKSTVLAEVKRGYPRFQNVTDQQFNYTPPPFGFLNGARPPYDVRWYSPDSPEVKSGKKRAGAVYLVGTSVADGLKSEQYVGTLSGT